MIVHVREEPAGDVVRALALLVGLVLVTAVLWLASSVGPLPRLDSWAEAGRWYEGVGPATAAMVLVRVIALTVAGWLVTASALQLVACCLHGARLRSLADLITPRSLQRLVGGLAGMSLTAGLALPAPSAGALDGPQAGVAVLRPVDTPAGSPGGTATLRLVDEPAPIAAPEVADAPVPAADVVVVEPGDSLWSLAREALVDAGHPDPADAIVWAHWLRLIEANRSTLVVPTNPDLIYAGQVFVLPAPEPGT